MMTHGESNPSPAPAQVGSRGGCGRRLLFSAGLLLLTYGLIEGAAAGAYWVRYGASFSFAAVSERREHIKLTATGRGVSTAEASEPDKGIFAARVIHPYTGFASEPYRLKNDPACNINKYGFYGAEDFLARPEGSVNVVITGGSLANHCLCNGSAELLKQLGTVPAFKGKKIRLIGLTAGGFKQPQQAMALSYFLCMGGRADLAILVDGFNEAVFGSEQEPAETHPAYPEKWHLQMSFLNDRERAKALGAARAINAFRRRLLGLLEPLDFSVLANVFWRLADGRLEQEVNRQHAAAGRATAHRKGIAPLPRTFARHGPQDGVKDVHGFAVDLWAGALKQMALLSRANGFPLFAFLQPNQYLKQSKPLSAEEQRDHYSMRFVYTKLLNKGYARMRKLGAALQLPGLTFKDLSNIFSEVRETLYVDSCCHINRRGCNLLFQQVGAALRAGMEPPP